MASETENLALTLLTEGQAGAEIVINEALQVFDVLQYGLPSSATNTPPGSPSNNDVVLVGTSPTGAFVGHENELALWLDGAWRFYALPSSLWSTSEILLPERRESANVYAKVINIAAGPDPSGTNPINTAHGITGLDLNKPIGIEFYAYDGTTAYHGASFSGTVDGYNVWVDTTNVVWESQGVDYSGFTGRARLVYSKT